MKLNSAGTGQGQASEHDSGRAGGRGVARTDDGTHNTATMQAVPQILEAWRERGYDRLDPVRFHFIDAFASRAASHRGLAQAVLHGKLMAMLQAYEALIAGTAPHASDAGTEHEACRFSGGPLAELVAGMNRQALDEAPFSVNTDFSGRAVSYPELPAVDYFQQTWARLRTRRQVQASQELVPDNAGPLNSNSLVHRALSLMREVSPDYLQHFLTYVDTLSWLEQADAGGGALTKGSEAKTAKTRRMK